MWLFCNVSLIHDMVCAANGPVPDLSKSVLRRMSGALLLVASFSPDAIFVVCVGEGYAGYVGRVVEFV